MPFLRWLLTSFTAVVLLSVAHSEPVHTGVEQANTELQCFVFDSEDDTLDSSADACVTTLDIIDTARVLDGHLCQAYTFKKTALTAFSSRAPPVLN